MPDKGIKKKPKMDKPKQKSKGSSLPKDARQMLMREYRKQVVERDNDVKQRPEQQAVNTVEEGMHSAGRSSKNAVKRGANSLSGSRKKQVKPNAKNMRGNSITVDTPADYTTLPANTPKTRKSIQQDKTAQTPENSRKTQKSGTTPAAEKKASQHTKKKPSHTTKARKSKEGFHLNTRDNAAKKALKQKKAAKRKQQVKRAAEATKKLAVKAARAVKQVVKALARATAAMVKSLLAAAGPAGVIIILFIVIAAIAVVAASPFGVFVSGEDEGSKNTMQQTVAAISYDYHQKIQTIIAQNSHDELRFEYINHGYMRTDNWADILAIYAVKTADFDSGTEVISLDSERVSKIEAIFWDMQKIRHEVVNEPIYVETEVENPKTGEIEIVGEYIDHHVLYIRAECIGAWAAAISYGFSEKQKEILTEMLSGEYDGFFNEMIGATSLFTNMGTGGGGAIGLGQLIWPSAASNYISSPFGMRVHPITGELKFHNGIDIPAAYGTAVLAADNGTVISNSVDSSFGIHLLIDHGNGVQTLYAHMSAAHFDVGDVVEQRQIIGLVGSTGSSTNPHLHFEVRVGGISINPVI